jgi:hypothetical protein
MKISHRLGILIIIKLPIIFNTFYLQIRRYNVPVFNMFVFIVRLMKVMGVNCVCGCFVWSMECVILFLFVELCGNVYIAVQ